jgi:hypothetical protein
MPVETTKINEMFKNAPSTAFSESAAPLIAPNDFNMESEQVSSASEDLSAPEGFSVRLADFGMGKLSLLWLLSSKLERQPPHGMDSTSGSACTRGDPRR